MGKIRWKYPQLLLIVPLVIVIFIILAVLPKPSLKKAEVIPTSRPYDPMGVVVPALLNNYKGIDLARYPDVIPDVILEVRKAPATEINMEQMLQFHQQRRPPPVVLTGPNAAVQHSQGGNKGKLIAKKVKRKQLAKKAYGRPMMEDKKQPWVGYD